MFSKLALFAFVTPLVSALTINAPSTQCASGGQCTISWTAGTGDPASFSLELVNTAFHDTFAIANNLLPGAGSTTIELPIVPATDGYTLEAVQIGNIGNVYSTSGSFSISAESSSSSSSSSTSSSSSSGTKSGGTTTAIPTGTPATTSAFGVTNTAPASSITPAGTSTGTGTGTAAAGAATSSAAHFNAASSLSFGFNAGSVAVLLLSAVAGAAVVAL